MEALQTFLSTEGLCVGYISKEKEKKLFEGLDLALLSGELVCFMGPNGAGKSTLLRTLAGLQKPISGAIEVTAASTPEVSSIAVVLTDPVHTLNLTVEEIVTYGRYPYLNWNIRLGATDREIISDAIGRVGIAHLRDQKIYELSDGQLQMVMIARALAQDTSIILLDEPTAHLDLNNRLEIMNLLKQLTRKTGKAILVATHELDLALQTADKIWLTGNKKNILTGLPEDLVLNGAFDDIFQFKGFDLKTGKVLHDAYRNVFIQLVGEGANYLWTRNALERNGYTVSNENQAIIISIMPDDEMPRWLLRKDGFEEETTSLEILLNSLNKRLQ